MDQHVNGMPFLPWLPQISPIVSESQASLPPGRPAGTAGPAHELLSASAQMALQRESPDTSTDEGEGGKRRVGEKKGKGGRSLCGQNGEERKVWQMGASSTFLKKVKLNKMYV